MRWSVAIAFEEHQFGQELAGWLVDRMTVREEKRQRALGVGEGLLVAGAYRQGRWRLGARTQTKLPRQRSVWVGDVEPSSADVAAAQKMAHHAGVAAHCLPKR